MPTDHPEFVHHSLPGEDTRLIAETVAAVEAAGGRAVIGPWLGEVGFEVLYWIPFLHWLFERHGLGPAMSPSSLAAAWRPGTTGCATATSTSSTR